MQTKTLLLTPWMTPYSVVHWQVAVTLDYLGKVEVLEHYDEILRSPSVEIFTPAVARLVKAPPIRKGVKFSRINVYTRDGFRCQYCGERKAAADLNYDHVVPRRQGGRTVWENIVSSCYACNDRKGSRTPEQANMTLLRPPFRPKTLPATFLPDDLASMPRQWVDYCSPFRAAVASDAAPQLSCG
jgi:5-methylcytosine-specific restriction endonuclease McrA